MIYKMTLKDSVDTMTFNLLETPIVDKDIEGAVDNVTLDGNQYTDYLYLKKQYIQKWAIMCPDGYDQLRGFYTRQFEDGEVPSYRLYYGANVTRDYTLNGDYFQFNAEGIETGMTLSQLLGNAEQTTYSGKNLFHFPLNISTSLYGVAITASANASTFVLNGTSTATSAEVSQAMIGTSNPFKLKAGTYTCKITGLKQYTVQAERVYLAPTSAVGTPFVTLRPDNGWTMTFTLTEDTDAVMYLILSSQSSHSNTEVALQIESGSTATAYEPYVGGIPAPNPSYPQPISTVTGAQTVRVTGKNLLDITQSSVINQGTYVSGANTNEYKIKATGNDIFVNAVGVVGSTWNSPKGNLIPCNYGETIYFNVGNNGFQKNYFTEWDENLVSLGYNQVSSSSGTYTPTSQGCKYVNFRFGNGYSVPDTTYTLSPIVCKTSDTSFEPYQGQSQEINLGKNLWGGFTYTWASSWNFNTVFNEDGSFSISGNASTSTWSITTAPALANACIKLEAGTYTFSFSGTASRTQLVSVRPDGTGEIAIADISAASGSKTFTLTEARCLYPRIQVSAGDTSLTEKCMIQVGSQETSYAPYFTPIELSKVGDYQDYIWNDGGTWKIHKSTAVAVLNGTEAWSESGTTHERFLIGSGQATFSLLARGTPSYKSKCDHFTFQEGGTAWTGIGRCGFDGLGTFWCMISGMSSLADFKAWLGANNVRVYYPLATPTTTEITDEALLLQLNFLASLYEGVNNISLVGTGAQGEMEVFIRDVMSVETDVVPEVPVRLTLTDDGVINACGCRRNVQLTMRETTE